MCHSVWGVCSPGVSVHRGGFASKGGGLGLGCNAFLFAFEMNRSGCRILHEGVWGCQSLVSDNYINFEKDFENPKEGITGT